MFRRFICLICLAVLLVTAGCDLLYPKREIREQRSISEFTVVGDVLYFGAGYNLYRLNLSTRSIATLFTSDHIRVEQPIVADSVAYFGGRGFANRKRALGAWYEFFAVDLSRGQVQWKFDLDPKDYGTFETFPSLAGDRILVCARKRLYCLDRKSGQVLWHVANWFGNYLDHVLLPYIYKNFVYFVIAEDGLHGERTAKNNGYWAVVALDSGERMSIIPISARHSGIGALVDGVIYGATRLERFERFRRFGVLFAALDLEAKQLVWEIEDGSLSRPAVNDRFVFTASPESTLKAIDRKTGTVVWSAPLHDLGTSEDFYQRLWLTRFAASKDVVVVQGTAGIAAYTAGNGNLLWSVRSETGVFDGGPLIFQHTVIASSAKECRVFALDLESGQELWGVGIPDCTYYHVYKVS